MDDVARILVVSRMTRYCRKAVHYGVTLAQKFGAQLSVLHVVHEPLFSAWNLPMPSLEDEYKKTVQEAKEELDAMIDQEKKKGVPIKVLIGEGEPTEEILRVVTEEALDLLVMLGHEEGRLEHFIFGRSNEELVRLLPCSILIVKQEPAPVKLFER